MIFVKITARECNADGIVHPTAVPKNLLLNTNLIAAIDDKIVIPNSKLLVIGGRYYSEIRLSNPINEKLIF